MTIIDSDVVIVGGGIVELQGTHLSGVARKAGGGAG